MLLILLKKDLVIILIQLCIMCIYNIITKLFETILNINGTYTLRWYWALRLTQF
jgi:hypothetical protein